MARVIAYSTPRLAERVVRTTTRGSTTSCAALCPAACQHRNETENADPPMGFLTGGHRVAGVAGPHRPVRGARGQQPRPRPALCWCPPISPSLTASCWCTWRGPTRCDRTLGPKRRKVLRHRGDITAFHCLDITLHRLHGPGRAGHEAGVGTFESRCRRRSSDRNRLNTIRHNRRFKQRNAVIEESPSALRRW
jgi:hypothetical protein